MLNSITPCFIVDDLKTTINFYESRLGFKVLHKGGGEKEADDFWAFMNRDQVMISFKAIMPDIHPQPNCSRHEWARWDAYIFTSDPDALYEEFMGKKAPIHRELADTPDGLRAFEIKDNNEYVLCFGRPLDRRS